VAEFPRPPGAAIAIWAMRYYRAYTIGEDGHIVQALNLDCKDDSAAVESAKQFVNGHDIEVWQEDRMVATLRSDDLQ
jgi:hypothetical protein